MRIMGGERHFGKDNWDTFDELAIWSRLLSEEEIKVLYNNGHGVEIPAK
jgi:hypothetical protein